jgi:MFS transporter, DHA1 family, inner membrane transport protein
LPTFLEMNVGLDHRDLKYMYIYGGLATLVTMTLFGRMSDRFGKLLMFRILAASAMLPMVVLPILPARTALPLVLIATTLFMVAISGRWVPAMALITASSAPSYRGSFLSFNTALQQISAGVATSLAGFILGAKEGEALTGFPMVGVIACVATVVSLVLAGRLHKDPGGDLAPDSAAVGDEAVLG